jgi:hypothetical protein
MPSPVLISTHRWGTTGVRPTQQNSFNKKRRKEKMKREMNQRRPFGLLIALAAIILLSASASTFAQPRVGAQSITLPVQKGVGKPYGSRDPAACPDLKGAAPSAEIAKASFICNIERVVGVGDAGKLYLVEGVTVQVGRGRPYNPNTEVMDLSGIDTTVPVYPIRGSYKEYVCEWAAEKWANVGKNCGLDDFPHAEGLCYKNEWGNWVCRMTDVRTNTNLAKGTAPPGGAKPADKPAAPKVTQNPQPNPAGQNPQPRNEEQKKDDKQENADRDENGYPKPDLSVMDKWFEITKVEYGDLATDKNLHFLFKPKIDWRTRVTAQLRFEAQYLDKDGVVIASYALQMDGNTDVGQVGKAFFPTPSEREMEKVVSVKIVRLKQ